MLVKKFGKGDVVWLDFRPTSGHEQARHRPAMVVSPEEYNVASDLMLVCPMTTKKKDYPFEVQEGKGVVLVDQVHSVDWRARNAKKKGRVSEKSMREVTKLLKLLIE